MIETTTAYKEEMLRLSRGRMFMRIEFGLINPEAQLYHQFSSNSEKSYSSFQRIFDDKYIVESSYSTFEDNRTKADGRLLIPPSDSAEFLYQGYVSQVVSNGNCIFEGAPPYVNISFEENGTPVQLNFPGISLMFDRVAQKHPAKIRFFATSGGAIVYDRIYSIESYMFAEIIPLPNIDNMRIEFVETQEPYQHVRLMNLRYGVGLTWANDNIDSEIGVTKTVDIDPLNRRLPVAEIKLGILDFEHFFNLDDPSGIYELMESRLPIQVYFGKEIPTPMNWSDVHQFRWSEIFINTWSQLYEGGYHEWFKVGEFLLDGKPQWAENAAELNGLDLIGFMTDEYYKGTYQRKSLYDIAVEVIEDADLIPRVDLRDNYALWDGLREIYTESPMPIGQHNECLRLIAHASNCVFYTDRENIIRIEPLDETQHDYFVDYGTSHNMPTAGLVASLRAVESEVSYWHLATNDRGQLVRGVIHRSTVLVSGEHSDVLKFQTAIDISISVSSNATVVSQRIYSAACELTIRGNGLVDIEISGVAVNRSIGVVRVEHEGGDRNGEVERLENVLITDIPTAEKQAAYHKDWLRLRTTYRTEYRGEPSLETMDRIYFQSEFTEKFSARVLRHEWIFTGALEGQLIIKNLDAIR